MSKQGDDIGNREDYRGHRQDREEELFSGWYDHQFSEERVTGSLDKIVANHPLIAAVRRSMRQLRAGKEKIVVAVSGGPDSIALLAALSAMGINPLVVAHINHKLRGAESDEDECFVASIANRLGLQFHTQVAPLPFGSSIETAARQLRYERLLAIAQLHSSQAIATAHTLDDQSETVVMRLLRGTGITGLGGIPPVRRWRGIRIIRPLLGVRRVMVDDFLYGAGLPFRTDSSNADIRFTRNRIRNEVMPLLIQSGQPHLVERLGRLSRDARRLNRLATRQAWEDARTCELARAGEWVVLDANMTASLAINRLIQMLRLLWRRENWPCREMSRRHWRQAAEVSKGRAVAFDCPGGIRIRRLDRIVRAGPGA